MSGSDKIDRQTIADFGRQWLSFTDNTGHYGSVELLADIVEPLLPLIELKEARVAEIGSGSGRIVNMLLDAGAASVVAVEPSDAVATLRQNTQARRDQVHILNMTGDQLPAGQNLDLVVAIGVLHHIVDPLPVVRAAFGALRPGGKILIWLYGREGNELYLATVGRLRSVTKRLPHTVLSALSEALTVAADLYGLLCRAIRLPMRDYVLNVYAKLGRDKRKLVIYDQLNPAYSRYYAEGEARALLEQGGFVNVRLHHRHGYSWTVIGERATLEATS
jgi:SAM-dependent methyltransferase